jgi:hypothetical protein
MVRHPPPATTPADTTDDASEEALLAARITELEAELARLHAARAAEREATLAPLVKERARLVAELADLDEQRARRATSREALAQFGPGALYALGFAVLPLTFLTGLSVKGGALALLGYGLLAAAGWWRGSRA